MRKTTGNSKIKNLKILKKLISFNYKHLLKTSFSVHGSYFWLTKFCWKNFLMASLMRNDRKCWLNVDISFDLLWQKNFFVKYWIWEGNNYFLWGCTAWVTGCFFIECLCKNGVSKYIIKVNLFIINTHHRCNRIEYCKIIINVAYNA